MKLSFPSPEFDDAVAAVCHGSANEAEMRALNVLLRSNSSARDEYLMRVELHTRLASEPDLFSQAADAAASCRLPGISTGDRRNILSLNPAVPATRRKLVRALALAACLMFIAGGVWTLWFKRSATRNGAPAAPLRCWPGRLMLVGAGTRPLRVGSALEPGWLRLEAGLAQVVFYSGARVVIEGPTELRLISPTEAVCPAGRLLAEVPQPARGFRLKTAQVNVVDRGTAFGIDATRGQTEVHVFKGEVELFAGSRGKAVTGRGASGRGAGERSAAAHGCERGRHSLRCSNFQQRSLASEAIRYEQWQFASARLNQDPSLVVAFGFREPERARTGRCVMRPKRTGPCQMRPLSAASARRAGGGRNRRWNSKVSTTACAWRCPGTSRP